MIKGIDVTLYERTQTGEDDFGAAVYSETPVTVHNVLVGEPETADLVNELQLYGKRLAYVLAIPKGDTHDWEGAAVAFFGQKFRAYGSVTQGMEAMIPLRWNKKVKVNRAAVRALMKSPEMREILAEQAQAIAGRCGDGYETRVGTAETRAIATVYPADAAARRDNHKNNTLERALR